MAYQNLRVSPNAPDRVRNYIERFSLDTWFEEAHWLLSRESEPSSNPMPFRHVTALYLLELIGGISTVFFHPSQSGSGARYKELLATYYPWDLEPQGGADKTTGPKLLYKAFRNPFAHELGIPDPAIGGGGFLAMSLPESDLETLERSLTMRHALAAETIRVGPGGPPSLHIPGLYWGLRVMVYRLTDDAAMMLKIMPTLR